MKIRETVSNDLDLNKYYLEHDLEQYLRGFSHRIGQISCVMLISAITFKHRNSKNT